MNLHGWKQLAWWSIEHACLSDQQKKEGFEYFDRDWEPFCEWIVMTYGKYADDLPALS